MIKPENQENPPIDPKIAEFLSNMEKAAEVLDQRRQATRQEALNNVPKFREATKQYLNALGGLKLPDCYVKTLRLYIDAIMKYRLERRLGLCDSCEFPIGVVMPIFIPPNTQMPQEAAAEEDKEVNIYYEGQGEKTAKEVTATAENQPAAAPEESKPKE